MCVGGGVFGRDTLRQVGRDVVGSCGWTCDRCRLWVLLLLDLLFRGSLLWLDSVRAGFTVGGVVVALPAALIEAIDVLLHYMVKMREGAR